MGKEREMMSFDDRNEEKDGFWDIEKLIPKKKNASLSPFATKPAVKDYSVDLPERERPAPEDTSRRAEEQKLSFEHRRDAELGEEHVYYPENTLIKSITVRKYKESYDFYDSFRRAALLYFDCPGEKCDFAQFYSYMPQYSQLTKAQKSYYLYWRHELRQGRFIRTDYSYLYLLVYEIINLPDRIEPEKGVKLLCHLWREYRKALPRIDMYFSMWVRDYCLVHELDAPVSELQDFIFDVIRSSDLKEYYFTSIGEPGREGVWSLIAYLSDYDWHKGFSTIVGKENSEDYTKRADIYKTLLEGSMRVILPSVWQECMREKEAGKLSKISRQAFPNTLCTRMVKSRLEIEYYPLADASELRAGITAAVRYTENKLRALFGAKSRLAIKYIPKEYKELIDCYFDELLRKSEARVKKQNLPEYEKLYDAPREKLSFAGADEIERLSWDTTMRLCETDEYSDGVDSVIESETAADVIPTSDEVSASQNSKSDTYGLSESDIRYLRALSESSVHGGHSIDEDAAVERINEAFSDGFGDVIIEDTGDGFAIIEDYKEEILEWLKNL